VFKNEDVSVVDCVPITFILCETIQGVTFKKPVVALLDSGSTTSWINAKSLPNGIQGRTVTPITGATMAGTFKSNQEVTLGDMTLPEFYSRRTLPKLAARIFYTSCRYDLILGRDVLRAFGLSLDFEENRIICDGRSVAMRDFPADNSDYSAVEQLIIDYADSTYMEDSVLQDDDLFATAIKDSDYDPRSAEAVVNACTHLDESQRADLTKLFAKFSTLFNNDLKVFPDEKIHLEVDPSATPHRSRHYTVPRLHLETFKKELDRLVLIGVLKKCGRSNWASGTFIIPKKDGRVRWVSDFRALNKALKRRFYPLPKIQEILSRRKGYKYLSKMDISMQYYTFEMDEESQELCTIATPFGLY